MGCDYRFAINVYGYMLVLVYVKIVERVFTNEVRHQTAVGEPAGGEVEEGLTIRPEVS